LSRRVERKLPGDSNRRQPVHTVYGGAHLFRADTAPRLGEAALKALEANASDARAFAAAFQIDPRIATAVFERVRSKLKLEPVEDFRIDFEDGYGLRPDAEEDATATAAAGEVARGMKAGSLPPFIGIRIKQFSGDLLQRGSRTLDLFLDALLRAAKKLPANFVVTLPKVVRAEQVKELATRLAAIERRHKLARGALQLEIMVETPQAIVDADGRCPLRSFVAASGGRCVAAHFGVYDYTASLNVTAAEQRMGHPACDHARSVMQVALAGSGVWLSDGATNIIPVGSGVLPAWRQHFTDVRHSLSQAFYQGWDLHPAQLPSRYAAVYSFFLAGLAQATERLSAFIANATKATLVGEMFDDAATGQALLNSFLRGLSCGALTEQEARATGLTLDEIAGRSFLKILTQRRAGVHPQA
jgi:citrate lyase beta subunit